MSAEVKLGLDAVLTIDGAEIKNVKDLTINLEKAEADASTRANNGWRATFGTLKDASIEIHRAKQERRYRFRNALARLTYRNLLAKIIASRNEICLPSL